MAVLDWYSRYVISWELDLTLEEPFVLEAMVVESGESPRNQAPPKGGPRLIPGHISTHENHALRVAGGEHHGRQTGHGDLPLREGGQVHDLNGVG